MRILVLATQNGGTGKTTLACSLAVAAMERGLRAGILDADPQATAQAWYRLRDLDGPDVAGVEPAGIPAVAAAAGGRYDLLMIDTAGQASAANATLRAADLCIVPRRPAPADILAVPVVAEAARKLG